VVNVALSLAVVLCGNAPTLASAPNARMADAKRLWKKEEEDMLTNDWKDRSRRPQVGLKLVDQKKEADQLCWGIEANI
jgi:hypothetical protein